jgi:hypothetical protein
MMLSSSCISLTSTLALLCIGTLNGSAAGCVQLVLATTAAGAAAACFAAILAIACAFLSAASACCLLQTAGTRGTHSKEDIQGEIVQDMTYHLHMWGMRMVVHLVRLVQKWRNSSWRASSWTELQHIQHETEMPVLNVYLLCLLLGVITSHDLLQKALYITQLY